MIGDCLVVREGSRVGTEIPLDAQVWIGRDVEGAGSLGGDELLSRHHARISRGVDGHFVIEDLESTNGTFVNAERLRSPRALNDGDAIKVGHSILVVRLAAPVREPALTKVDGPVGSGHGAGESTKPELLQPPNVGERPHAAGADPIRRQPRSLPPVGAPSVIRAGLPPSMKGLIFPSVGLLVVQIIIGYEWLLSGLTKIFRGGFPQGLGANLIDQSKAASGWYRSFVHSVIIPVARPFGYLIEVTELAVGVVLIGAALLWLFRWDTMHRAARSRMLLGTVAACAAAIFMNLNFFLASGSPVPFFLAKDAFSEGVGLDALLPTLELVLAAVALWTYLSIRRARTSPKFRGVGARHVVVVGGGFAGLAAVRGLERSAPAGVRVTIISDANYLLYTPLLPAVAAGSLEPTSVVVPLRQEFRNADLRLGRIVGGNVQDRELEFEPMAASGRPGQEPSDTGQREVIGYDELVIALGSVSRTRDVPGLTKHAIGLKTLAEAVALRNWLIGTFEVAEATDEPELRAAYLTYVFVGAGYAGVEGIAELHEFAEKTISLYPRCRAQGTRWILAQSGEEIMPEIGHSLAEFAHRKLAQRGIEVWTGKRLASVEEDAARLSSGEIVPTRTVVWTAGVRGHPVLDKFGLALDDRGRVIADGYMRAVGCSHIWAVGDAAAVPDSEAAGDATCPPTAQHAVQQGRAVAANIAGVLGAGQPKPFVYRSRGGFVDLGRRNGVAKIYGLRLRGLPAWLAGRAYHASRVPGTRRKLRLIGNWGMAVVHGRDASELGQLGHPREMFGELEEQSAGGSVIRSRRITAT